jgi:L-asparagine transporter-like permease
MPLDIHVQLSKEQAPNFIKEIVKMEKVPYKAIVGCMMGVMITTRLNIVIKIGILNQFVQDPRYVHLRATK